VQVSQSYSLHKSGKRLRGKTTGKDNGEIAIEQGIKRRHCMTRRQKAYAEYDNDDLRSTALLSEGSATIIV
jgi:hypothetical protein